LEATGFKDWQTSSIRALRDRSFREFPERLPAAEPAGDAVGVTQPLTAEAGIHFHVIALVPTKAENKKGTLLILNPDEEILTVTREWAKPYVDDRTVLAILPRGSIPSKWTIKNPPNTIERSLALLGSTVDTGRVRDVAGAARLFDEVEKGKVGWRVVGRGQAGVIAAYAAIFEPSIKEVVIVDPPTSHRDGPHFLNVLRVLDIPDALGLLAPRPLTIIGGKDKAFDRTAEIYKLAGAADKLKRE
jgi:hypothetical protein